MFPRARTLLAVACAALLHGHADSAYIPSDLPFPDDPACSSVSIGKTDDADPSTQKTVLKPIRLKGVPGGSFRLNIPDKIIPPRKLVGEKVAACDYNSGNKPTVNIVDGGTSPVEVVANVKWPLSTNLIVFVVQYS